GKRGPSWLRDGKRQITARPESKPQRALCDLRGIILVKEGAAEPKVENPAPPSQPQTIDDIARAILDDARSVEERARLISDHPEKPAEILAAMVRDLKPGTKEEYRRIPWIWRVAIAAGKRNDTTQIRKILELCLPKRDEELLHWQAVVIGGGIINGLTQVNVWPRDRLREIVRDDKSLLDRLDRSTHKASHMAHDKKVPTGTRYDALRMMGIAEWDSRGDELVKFSARGMDDEIQMCAVSGLGDMRAPEATAALVNGINHHSKQNRELALDALMRDTDRVQALLDAVATGKLTAAQLGENRLRVLKEHSDAAVRKKAQQVFAR